MLLIANTNKWTEMNSSVFIGGCATVLTSSTEVRLLVMSPDDNAFSSLSATHSLCYDEQNRSISDDPILNNDEVRQRKPVTTVSLVSVVDVTYMCHPPTLKFVLKTSRKALVSVSSTIVANERFSWVLETSATLETFPTMRALQTNVLNTCVKAHSVFGISHRFQFSASDIFDRSHLTLNRLDTYDTHYEVISNMSIQVFSRCTMRIKRFLSIRNVVHVIKQATATAKKALRGNGGRVILGAFMSKCSPIGECRVQTLTTPKATCVSWRPPWFKVLKISTDHPSANQPPQSQAPDLRIIRQNLTRHLSGQCSLSFYAKEE
ncbi:hypothetical protein PsorP6_015154 [Peronosclerospora sorghi]|uniref:Uncharacterized protein n=1 Tax=Peronosclerospora sorghi TaxID=230839 RepID=A0ACC0VSA2_9STRA|nr:hypothetical protein PsorP6_015154 [Peronosclerospora sorghi]